MKPATSSIQNRYDKLCMLANRMNGSLTVIVGQCDLILQMSDLPEPVKQGLEAIKQVALSTANGINSHQCRISPEPDWRVGQIPISSNQTRRPPRGTSKE